MTEEELREVEAGLPRWHSVSPDTARKLIAEVRQLRRTLAAVWNQLDGVQDRIEKAQPAGSLGTLPPVTRERP